MEIFKPLTFIRIFAIWSVWVIWIWNAPLTPITPDGGTWHLFACRANSITWSNITVRSVVHIAEMSIMLFWIVCGTNILPPSSRLSYLTSLIANTFLLNNGNHLKDHMASQSRRLQITNIIVLNIINAFVPTSKHGRLLVLSPGYYDSNMLW